MGSLSVEDAELGRSSSFKSLKLVDVELEREFEEQPFGADYGRLENGLVYYVRCNSKPRHRAALALAVKVGSVLEEENERGVAHIVEHLAFSATKKYTNHDIVRFLESIGAEFGPCHNAYTSSDETVYEMFVPIDKPGLLSEAISVLAEFSSEIRISKDDLKKERGAVMEEYRSGRDASGRAEEACWVLMMEGSKYAQRLPIGLEKVIRTVSSETVKQFYRKWYHPSNMAVVAVGDFPDTKNVVELIRTHFEHKSSASACPPMPYFPVPSHDEPRFSCFVDPETSWSKVMISYKTPMDKLTTVKDYRDMLVESMFLRALNKRFFKISRRKNPPYFSCSAAADVLVRPLKAYIINSSCKEDGILQALESILIEIARIRIYGFSEREISVVRALLLSDIESAYLERHQMKSTRLRYKYLQHFIGDEPFIGTEYEAQLQKTILPHITMSDVSEYAEKLQTSQSCVIKTVESRASAKVSHLKDILLKINKLERERSITPWDDEELPEEIVDEIPNPGDAVQQLEHSNIGATELILSNGMRVCYKCTDFYNDQVLFRGFSYGGLSELSESDYFSSIMGSSFAEEIGEFGYRPSVLTDMLAGKKAKVSTGVGYYKRTFYGSCSPSDLETTLQLVYKLFTTDVTPEEEEVKRVMQMAEEGIRAQDRDPYTTFSNRVTELNYGNSYFIRPFKMSDLQRIDPSQACEYFSSCFRDPSTFTVVIVGKIDPVTALPSILQYLGGIVKPSKSISHFNSDNIKGLPLRFPATHARELLRSPMVEAQCWVHISFPIELKKETMVDDFHYIGHLTKLIDTKITEVLRFKHGQIYSASASSYLDGNMHCRTDDIRGDISIDFSCDPKLSSKLVDLALEEVLRLQEDGPSDQDVSTILEIEQRDYENGLQENNRWLENICHSYQSRTYSGDVGTSYEIQDKARTRVRNFLNSSTSKLALQRILPFPCKKRYTVVIHVPQTIWSKQLRSFLDWTSHGRDAKVLAGIAGLAVLALSLRRYAQKS